MTDEMSFEQEPLPTDLSALDPTTPPLAFARRVVAVRNAAAGTLRKRRNGAPLAIVAHWRAPLLAALFLMMIISAVLFRSVTGETGIDTVGTDEVADVLGGSQAIGDGDDNTASTPAEILLGGYEQ
jgi:hypothetical protein